MALSKAQCHFCKKKILWGGFTSIVVNLQKYKIGKDDWSLGGFCLNVDDPICKPCTEKVKNLFL